ncbi:MAG: LysM peptidoglycan-binding domain-containing protein [Cyanobium sp. M30B3]|nr:MAG: LysM peptidoglycan-binding domain-containing protein [Cyanobium sp. M30B3]
MRRTLAALVLAITPPLTVLAVSGVQAQQVVTVRTGETLSEIAERHGVSLSRLMQANGIANPDHVEIGQRLTIPGSGSTARSSSSPSGTRGTAPYTVKSGETLSEIADRFNTTAARLIQINSISDPDLVMSGTRLQVPLTAQRSASAASSSPPVNRNASEHVVQSGENLSLIAERYGTSVSRLVALNQLEDPELVTVGTRLKLRGTPPAPRSTPPAASKPKPAAPPPAATTPAAQPVAAQPVAAQPAPAPAQPSGSATTPATTTTSATPSVTTAATSASVAAATAAAPLSGPATAATTAATAATAATTSAINRSAPVSAASRAPAAATTAATTAATRASSTAAGQATPVAAARPAGEWRNYGPLQVDWSKIQPMGGSYVAPSLNSEGQPLYLAVNCTARKINVTSQAGQWRTWENPSKDFEHKLVKDICQANRS